MPTRKNGSTKTSKKISTPRNSSGKKLDWSDDVPTNTFGHSPNGNSYVRPHRLNGETDEEREKRLAARERRTLQAFQAAYESHNRPRRKAS
jgi:hypothetical protein